MTAVAHASISAKDPVCGMLVDPATAKHKAEHAGAIYYFCSAGCRGKFVAEPARFLAPPTAPSPKPAPAGATYTCPMHPEIRQLGPGHCPICGMALEPEVASAGDGPSAELIDMSRRFWVALVLSVPVFALEMGGHLTNLHMLAPQGVSNWLQLALATPVVLWAGWPFFRRGFASLKTRNLNMFTLIAMGVGVAWAYSVVATIAPGHISASVPRRRRRDAGLFRGRGRHHDACPALPVAGTAGARTDRRGDPGAHRSRSENRAARPRRWRRRGRRSRRDRSRRSVARAAGREDPGRR